MTAKPKLQVFEGEFSAPKYQSGNPIARYLVNNFLETILHLAQKSNVKTAHEIGCGEGQITGMLAQNGFDIRGCDYDEASLTVARHQAQVHGLSIPLVKGDIYALDMARDRAPLVLCCEVLEHLERPEEALKNLCAITESHLLLSVPREPIWCMLNMARGKYLSDWGNTPTHINHWSTRAFVKFVSQYIDVIDVRTPLPWTVLLCRKR